VPASETKGATSRPATAPTSTATHLRAAPRTATPTYVPTGAPATGGGGTAGLQDGALFGLGGAAILAGAGFLAYRRRITRT